MKNKNIDFIDYNDDELNDLLNRITIESKSRKDARINILIKNFETALSELLKNDISITIYNGHDDTDSFIDEHTDIAFDY